MLNRIIDLSLRYRGAVVFAVVALAALGMASAWRIPMDAVPDITSPQVQINTAVRAFAPDEVETRVTVPIEIEMAGLPGLVELRSLSKFGLSQVTMTFEDGVDILRVRQLVGERLAQARDHLPADVTPTLAPISTGLGEIVYYTLDYRPDAPGKPATRPEQLQQLRLVHDTLVRPLLRATPGVADVNAIGGYEKQIVVEPDPSRLAAAGISFDHLVDVLRRSTENAGGGIVEVGGEAVVIRADTRVRTAAEIAELPLKLGGSVEPLLIHDVATVGIGSATRTGNALANGEDTVLGAVIMLTHTNGRVVAQAAVETLRSIQRKLPTGMVITPRYDRSDLVNATIRTVETNLAEGAVLVAAVLFALFGNWRAAIIVTLAIPLSFLFMLTGMAAGRVSANLMSLGAIDFGLIVDGAIVMVENILRRLAESQRHLGRALSATERHDTVRTAAREVARPMFFGVLIIGLVYVPILALGGIEGKMFRPMAIAVILAIGGALALALTLMPVLTAWTLGGELREDDGRLVRATKAMFRPLLHAALRFRWTVVALALLLFVGAGWGYARLGAEFIPQLDEGSLSVQMIRGTSVGLEASSELQRRSERLLLAKFPEIKHTFSRIGTAEIATDPMGPNVADTYVALQPKETWRQVQGRPITKPELIELMRHELEATVPGQTYLFTQPIQLRFNEIMAGARADLSLKIYGEDFAELERIATQARAVLETVPGAGDIEFEALGRIPTLEVTPKRDTLRRLNLHADEINATIGIALGGESAGAITEGSRRIEVVVRLPEHRRLAVHELGQLPLTGENGVQVPLARVATVAVTDRVAAITREDTRRRVAVLINVRGRDTEGYVHDASERLRTQLPLPPGYYWEFGGQFENLQAARARLMIVVPAALALILALIYASFGSARQAALVFVCVPLAATGGVASLWLRGLPFTISAAVGFIALSGIAVLNGIMLVSFINQLRRDGLSVRDAVVDGTLTRLRPKLMTALVASLGFVPMALATGPGAEVQRPLATVVIGGIVTSTFLTLIVLPVLYDFLEGRAERRDRNPEYVVPPSGESFHNAGPRHSA